MKKESYWIQQMPNQCQVTGAGNLSNGARSGLQAAPNSARWKDTESGNLHTDDILQKTGACLFTTEAN